MFWVSLNWSLDFMKLLFIILLFQIQQNTNLLDECSKIKNFIYFNYNKLETRKICLSEFAIGGSEGKVFMKNDSLYYAEVTHLGETWNREEKIYYKNGFVLFIESKETKYPRAYYEQSKDGDENQITSLITYFEKGNYLYSISDNVKITDSEIINLKSKYYSLLISKIKESLKIKCNLNED